MTRLIRDFFILFEIFFFEAKPKTRGGEVLSSSKGNRHSESTVDASLRVGARNLNVRETAEKRQFEENMS